MALREFTEAGGRPWQVWDTVPRSADEDRVFARNAQILAEAERRRREEEEGQVRGDAPAQHEEHRLSRPLAEAAAAALRRFSHGREHGWLTFMSGAEKRRLSPIPDGWEELDDAGLAALLTRAERVEQRLTTPAPEARAD